jgi:hypothetical protein
VRLALEYILGPPLGEAIPLAGCVTRYNAGIREPYHKLSHARALRDRSGKDLTEHSLGRVALD